MHVMFDHADQGLAPVNILPFGFFKWPAEFGVRELYHARKGPRFFIVIQCV